MLIYQLPPELVSAIIDYLTAEINLPSLRACSLTCRALAPPAQACLFHTVSISSEAVAGIVLRKLEATPHVGTFVKRLDFLEIHKPWIERSAALPKLFGLLSSYTHSLKIYQRRRKLYYQRFSFVPFSRLESLEEISLREEMPPGVSEGSAYGDNALPNFLNHFPKLKTITFGQCLVENQAIGTGSSVATKTAPPIFQLNRLDVRCCDDAVVLDWVIPALSSLQKLHISYLGPNAIPQSAASPKLIAAAGESLQYLEARDLYCATDADLKLLMNAVQKHAINLRSFNLKITGSPLSRFKHWNSPLQVAVQSLLFLNTHSRIQHLTIGISQYDVLASGGPWDDLEDLLIGTRFSALKSVEICLLKSGDSAVTSVEPIMAAVPRLAEKRMVYVSTVSEYS